MFHYENGFIKFIATAEGYAGFSTRGFNYVYNYTDHLGNIRLSYTKHTLEGNPPVIVEENNYYPFGLKHNGYNNISPPNNVYKYKFNGMELQDELGLNVYDFGARNYMPDLGRWANIDPLAEASRRWTPYNYAYNNPVYFIDPDGMQSDSNSGSGTDALNASDFDAMIDIGYGRKVKGTSFAGSGTFSNFDIKLNKSGEQKLMEKAFTEAVNILSTINQDNNKVSTEEENNTSINSPLSPGEVRFEGFTDNMLKNIRVIPEEPKNEDDLITPKNKITYDTDGLYFKGWTEKQYWLKIGDGRSVVFSYNQNNNELSYSNKTYWHLVSPIYAKYISVFEFRPKHKSHWTNNPFDYRNKNK